jgi:hypothetical protein
MKQFTILILQIKIETEALDMGVDDYLYSCLVLYWMGRTDSEFDSRSIW